MIEIITLLVLPSPTETNFLFLKNHQNTTKPPKLLLIPYAQRLVWAAKQALGKAALDALFVKSLGAGKITKLGQTHSTLLTKFQFSFK